MSVEKSVPEASALTALEFEHRHDMLLSRPTASRRPSMASRRLPEVETMQMAKDDTTAVDEEIADFEAQLLANPPHAPFLRKPESFDTESRSPTIHYLRKYNDHAGAIDWGNVNAVPYYLATLMSQIGFDRKTSVFMSLVGEGSLLLGTIPGVLYMEKFGCRFWACFTLPCFFVDLVLVGISYQMTSLVATEACYLTGLIFYMDFFGSYACLTWVIPSEVFPTYLRSYGMESTDFLFIHAESNDLTSTGLTLGFYGGIAVLGWIYQLLFMPETKNNTLEEIDLLFSQPTMTLVRQNIASIKETTSAVMKGNFREAILPTEKSGAADEPDDLKA